MQTLVDVTHAQRRRLRLCDKIMTVRQDELIARDVTFLSVRDGRISTNKP